MPPIPELFRTFGEASNSFDVSEYLPRLQCPTLVLHRRDHFRYPMSLARGLASRIEGANLVLLDGDALAYYLGDSDAVIKAINDFLPAEEKAAQEMSRGAGPRSSVVTILFTDIEGHTQMMQRLGDARGREVLREHERITREQLRAHGGTEVKTLGDGFMASFGSAQQALECAIALQRAFSLTPGPSPKMGEGSIDSPSPAAGRGGQGERVRIRIGVNAGEPIAEDDDLFGAAVIAAARIAARAQGGEVLVSNVVRELVAGKGFLFADRGEAALRGFDDPVRIFELRWQ